MLDRPAPACIEDSDRNSAAKLVAAVLFAFHPLRVESVVWISERKDVLSLFFGVLTLGSYAADARRPGGKVRSLTILCYAAGLMSKPVLVTLPAALLLLDFWPLDRLSGADPRRAFAAVMTGKLPLFALSAISCAVTWSAQSAGGAIASTSEVPPLVRLATIPAAGIAYVAKTLAPINLSCLYPAPETLLPWWVIAGSFATLTAMTLLVVRCRDRRPHLLVGWLWFFVTLAPVIGFVRVGEHFIADRYTYLPHLGLFAALAWEARAIVARTRARRLAALVGLALLTALSLQTRAQTPVWKDGLSLFEHADAATTENWRVKNYLGALYLESGRNRDAVRVYQEIIQIRPEFAEAHGNLGLALTRVGRFAEAVAAEEQALRLRPGFPEGANYLGSALAGLGRWEEAAAAHRRALALRPDYLEARNRLARALGRLNRHREAVEQLLAAITSDPGFSAAHFNLGAEYLALGMHTEALAATRKALALDPNLEIGHLQIGVICAQTGDEACSRREYELLLEVNAGLAGGLREEIEMQARDPASARQR